MTMDVFELYFNCVEKGKGGPLRLLLVRPQRDLPKAALQ